jgi:hypothetical protein
MEEEIKTGYPLQWPVQYKRTRPEDRVYGMFKQTPDTARKKLLNELDHFGCNEIVISSNVPLRSDGQMRSDYAARQNRMDEDPGVAVYFRRQGKNLVIPCDKFNAVWKNVYALALAIESFRRIERYDIPGFIDNAFSGFNKLLAPAYQDPWIILGVSPGCTEKDIDQAFKARASIVNPDLSDTGTTHQYQDLLWARQEAKRILKEGK